MVVKVEVELDEDDYARLRKAFDVNKEFLSDKVLNILGWNRMEVFLADLVMYGFEASGNKPMKFLKRTLDEKLPLFKEETEKGAEKRKIFEDEIKKAYS